MKMNRFFKPRSRRTTRPTNQTVARPVAIESLEDRQLLSLTIDLRVNGASNDKVATATKVGQQIVMDVWATVTGTTAGTNDAIWDIVGSFLSSKTVSTSVDGNLSSQLFPNFTADGAQEGTPQDLNGDGNLDVGSNNNGNFDGFFFARAGAPDYQGTVSGDTNSFPIAQLTYTVTNLSGGKPADLNFRWGDVIQAGGFDAVFIQDGKPRQDPNCVLAIGSPVVISDPNITTGSGALTGTVIGTAGSYHNDGNTIAKAEDGNLSTYFDGATGNGNWVGLKLSTADNITQIKYAPRSGWASRMVGGVFQGSNNPNFTGTVVDLASITSTPVTGSYTTVNVSNPGSFTYVRYLSPNSSFGDVSEVQFFGTAAKTAVTALSGIVIGTSGSYNKDGDTITNVFDGNTNTFFDGPTNAGDWAGLDLGSVHTVTDISFAPRSGWASRMVGGEFQASNSANFSSGVDTFYKITSAPAQNTLTTVAVNVSGYRYFRYIGPAGSFGDVSEVVFYG